jgi:hypothetical protein
MFREVMEPGASAEEADTLWKWDSGTQSYTMAYILAGWGEPYDGKWWDDRTGFFSMMTLASGECCWILRKLRQTTPP